MATEWIPQLTFKRYSKTMTMARFDQPQASTDGRVVLLQALDDHLQLTDRLAACLPDHRDPDKVRHAVRDLLAVGRDPVSGAALASQPTLSRFENAVSPRALYGKGRRLAAVVIAQHRHRLKGQAQRVTIDLDRSMTSPTGSRNWLSSMGTTILGALCPWWRR